MKKILALAMAALMVVGVLSGCVANEAATPEEAAPVAAPAAEAEEAAPAAEAEEAAPAAEATGDETHITWGIYYTDNLTAELYQSIIDDFEAANPGIKVDVMVASGDSRVAFWKTQYASGNFPDVVFAEGALASTEGLFAEVPADILDLFEEGAIATNLGGKHVTVPYAKQLRMQCYYNKADFEECGLEEPQTWDEFIAVCDALKAAGKVPMICGGTGDVWATGQPWWITVTNQSIVDKYPNFNELLLNGEVAWDDPVIVDSMKKWQDFIGKGYYYEGSMSYSYSQAAAEFQNGAASMMIDGSWAAAGFDAAGEEGFGVFAVPSPEGLKTYCTAITEMGVYADSKNLDASWQFLKWFFENKDVYARYLAADGLNSTTKDPATYEQGPVMNKFVANFDEWELVPEILQLTGEYALPSGMEDEANKILQNIYVGKNVEDELAALQVQYEMIKE